MIEGDWDSQRKWNWELEFRAETGWQGTGSKGGTEDTEEFSLPVKGDKKEESQGARQWDEEQETELGPGVGN